MKTKPNSKISAARFSELVEGPRAQSDLADALDIDVARVGNWLKRGVSAEMVPAVADHYGVPALWLQGYEEIPKSLKLQDEGDWEPSGPLPLGQDGYSVPRLDVVASMGLGAALVENPDIVERLAVNTTALRRMVNYTGRDALRFITGYGDSMEGTFNDGDLLLVDTGVFDVRLDAVYVLELNDELYIKRLQRRPDGSVLMISDNRKYEPYLIANGERDKFAVRGRVLLAWNAKRL